MNLLSLSLYNVKLQFRHGFYYAYLFVCIVYIILLRLLGPEMRDLLTPVLIFSDPSMLGIFFIGGIVFLEREDNTLQSLFVTPMRAADYCASKAISLGVLALLSSLLLAVAGKGGIAFGWPSLIAGTVLTSALFTFTGLSFSVRTESVIGYIMTVIPVVIAAAAPLLQYFGVAESSLFYLLPTQYSLTLLKNGFSPGTVPVRELLTSAGILVGWNFAVWRWAGHRFRQHLAGAMEV
ncbi:MAG: ABC transporter permease [Spirochaetia bacterium]